MKLLLPLMLVSVLLMLAAPAYGAEVTQVWRCELGDDNVTEEEVSVMAKAWLKAAKTMPGGAQLKASVYFPVAVSPVGQTDLLFVVIAPSFEDWGKFWDSYKDSPAEEADNLNREKVICPSSAMWESVHFE